ncbi:MULTISPECIES: NAD-dependent epimerase/dehydratase family protein [Actinoalloteichus]|uniref:NAD dependent epimerase/dehydratase family protein n=1 Tax=Actinoalloteichus fjordicus TaxID=1612552 RepID=A0AAC9LCL7_9PSEU|nr:MULTISPECIES: NAD-dependent epimerase/dehydratase family protein [Actinoalloteichus]APU15483.1 NAD dependent epimerase/dehydratase family protein [Actinoalloteichus fjordicus]APU21550.1 NAD dependent epimerase/dehydratase family protein [Actinoalloteichus sp. GBA129-24]
MEVIGNGFIARHLRTYFFDHHPDTTIIAAGVSRTTANSVAEFARELTLVEEVTRRCRAENRTVVFLSTAASGLYGSEGGPHAEDDPISPISPYGRHKFDLESMIAVSGANWLTLRLSSLVGDGQPPHQLVPSLTAQITSGVVTVYQGSHRDLLDVSHLMEILDRLLAAKVCRTVVNVASGTPQPVDRIVAGIEARLNRSARWDFVTGSAGGAAVSIARLRELVPEVATYGFGPGYLERLIHRYVAPIADEASRTPARLRAEEHHDGTTIRTGFDDGSRA